MCVRKVDVPRYVGEHGAYLICLYWFDKMKRNQDISVFREEKRRTISSVTFFGLNLSALAAAASSDVSVPTSLAPKNNGRRNVMVENHDHRISKYYSKGSMFYFSERETYSETWPNGR